MKRALVWIAPFAVLAGCQLFGKLSSRPADPVDDGCTLPTGGDTQIRLANLLPTAGTIDLCIKDHGASDYTRPLLRGAGLSCGGLAFKDVTLLFGATSRTIDAKAIASDAHVCSAPAIAETSGLTIASDAPTTLFLAGGNGAAPAIFAHSEGPPPTQAGTKLRFVNAIGATSLLFGLTQDPKLPSTLATPLSAAVPFGGVAPAGNPGLGTIDALGYLNLRIIAGTEYPMGAAKTPDGLALLTYQFGETSGKFSLYAIGDPTQPLYPVRALECEEDTDKDAGVVTGHGVLKVVCNESDPASLAIDVFSTDIIGAFGEYDSVRAPAVVQAIAARTSDVMCIPELAENGFRQQAIDLAKSSGNFPYVAEVDTDETTKFTDATGADGGTPALPSGAPCAEPAIKAKAESVYECITSTCGTPPNDPNGFITNDDIGCASSHCATKFAPLFNGTQAQQRCFGCILAGMISYKPFGVAETACETDPLAGYAFDAKSPTFILSKFPLTNVEAFVLPSTTFRRTIVRAELQLDEGDSVDLYCAKLTPNLGSAAPYSGVYGADWNDENVLQARKLVAWVKAKTTSGRRAIVMGEFDSSVEIDPPDAGAGIDAGGPLIAASNPETMQLLVGDGGFPAPSVPPNYVPVCSFCAPPANPYNVGTDPAGLWMSRVFLYNFSEGAPLSAEMTMKDFSVALPGDAGAGPLSTHWAYSVKIQRR